MHVMKNCDKIELSAAECQEWENIWKSYREKAEVENKKISEAKRQKEALKLKVMELLGLDSLQWRILFGDDLEQ